MRAALHRAVDEVEALGERLSAPAGERPAALDRLLEDRRRDGRRLKQLAVRAGTLEAGAMAIPVVASDTGGAAEMFPGDEHGGLIYRTGDVDALAARLASLVSEPQQARSVGARARRTVTERFSLERMESDWRRMLWPTVPPDAKTRRRTIATSTGH